MSGRRDVCDPIDLGVENLSRVHLESDFRLLTGPYVSKCVLLDGDRDLCFLVINECHP